MNNIMGQVLDEDDEIVLNVVNNNLNVVAYVVENLAGPLEPIDPERRNPGRNQNYVEQTIPLYTPDEFRNHFRMSRGTFEKFISQSFESYLLDVLSIRLDDMALELNLKYLILINEIGNRLPPTREPRIDLQKKVLFTIWILAKPETFLACSDRFGIAQSTGHYIYRDIITIISRMVTDFITWPTIRQCQENAMVFQERSRGVPNVIGAIDGTHIFIKQPVGNAADYFNRYQSHSLILQAVCDPKKKFINVSVGHPGRMHDARVFRRSQLYERITNEDEPLIRPDYHIIGDSAYPLLQEVLTPFRDTGHLNERQIRFNVRFSSIRSIIERAFALLKGKWRRLKYLDMSDLDLLNKVIGAACVLHNLIIDQEGEEIEIFDVEQDIPVVPINERRRHQLGETKRLGIVNNLN